MVYALADRGLTLLRDLGLQFANQEWSRKNDQAGRPFIEHQLEIVDFRMALEHAARIRGDIRIIHPEEIIASSPEQTRKMRNPFTFRATISNNGSAHDIAVIPDFVFGLMFPDGSRRCFMVEIDRGTMPVSRTDITQTSFERKMRAYLTVEASKQHKTQFGWKTFRVLTVTTETDRMNSMLEALRTLHLAGSLGASLFFFATREQLRVSDPARHTWCDANGRGLPLI